MFKDERKQPSCHSGHFRVKKHGIVFEYVESYFHVHLRTDEFFVLAGEVTGLVYYQYLSIDVLGGLAYAERVCLLVRQMNIQFA